MSTVLVVEPDPETRSFLTGTVKAAGLRPVGCLGVSQVVGSSLVRSAGLVLIGPGVPAERLVDALCSLSENAATTGIPVVVAGAAGSHADAATACAFGARDYICLPMSEEEIASKVKRALGAAAEKEGAWLDGALQAAGACSPTL